MKYNLFVSVDDSGENMILIVLRNMANKYLINREKLFLFIVFLNCTDNPQQVRIRNCEVDISSGEMKQQLVYIFTAFTLISFSFRF